MVLRLYYLRSRLVLWPLGVLEFWANSDCLSLPLREGQEGRAWRPCEECLGVRNKIWRIKCCLLVPTSFCIQRAFLHQVKKLKSPQDKLVLQMVPVQPPTEVGGISHLVMRRHHPLRCRNWIWNHHHKAIIIIWAIHNPLLLGAAQGGREQGTASEEGRWEWCLLGGGAPQPQKLATERPLVRSKIGVAHFVLNSYVKRIFNVSQFRTRESIVSWLDTETAAVKKDLLCCTLPS